MATATKAADATIGADVRAYCQQLTHRATTAARALAGVPGSRRNEALGAIAKVLRESTRTLQQQNRLDLDAGREAGLAAAMLDRLELTEARVEAMAVSVEQIAAQVDPVGQVIEGKVLDNGIRLEKVRVPIGVILIIFESRPNVTCDAAALCLKSGNAVILRGGKEARHSNQAIADCVRAGLERTGLAEDIVQLVGTTDRSAVGELLKMEGLIDLCIPRGGESLIRAVVEQAHIPVIKHYTGNCHVYIDADCDERMALDICLNAKTQRPGVCNAAETFLFHKNAGESGLLMRICQSLMDAGVELRVDERVCPYCPDCEDGTCSRCAGCKPATEADWATEFLDKVAAVKVVDSIDDAIAHINRYGSRHTDAIVTGRLGAADAFVREVDSANVFVNCSTRFSDGGQYGLGAEIGISTDKLHARGPMGAGDLTTYKWVGYGQGQVRG